MGGLSRFRIGILVHGVGASSLGGGARDGQWAERDPPRAGPELWQGWGLPGWGEAALTACALRQVARQQMKVGGFMGMLRVRGAIGRAHGSLEELSLKL